MEPVGEIINKAEYPNHVWSYDFVEDRTERDGKLKILAIIDEYTRECLNRESFRNGKEAQTIVETWRQEYNNHRPHSSLSYLTPSEFARRYYERNQLTEVKQPVKKAGSLSL